jgi:hypothetical protein
VIADALRGMDDDCRRDVSGRTFGSPAANWPRIANAVHCYFGLDPVTTIARFTNEQVRRVSGLSVSLTQHSFESYLVHAHECDVP